MSDSVALGFGFYVTARDVRNASSQVDFTGTSIGNAMEQARYKQRLSGILF